MAPDNQLYNLLNKNLFIPKKSSSNSWDVVETQTDSTIPQFVRLIVYFKEQQDHGQMKFQNKFRTSYNHFNFVNNV